MIREKFDRPRGVLRSGVDPGDDMRHRRFYPSPELAEYVEHFWSVEWDLREREPFRAETLPHPSVHMVFDIHGSGTIGGPSTRKFSRVLEGKGRVLAAKFTPAGFHPFAGRSVSDLADKVVALVEVFAAEGEELERDVLAHDKDADRIGVIEDFLLSRRPEPDENVALISGMVYAVAKDRQIIKVEDIVDRYGMNKRTLQRMFAKYVGVGPKWVIQRYRLHEAAEQLAAGVQKYTDLALDLGYSDQAHFVRDFKAVVGVSPAAYTQAVRK